MADFNQAYTKTMSHEGGYANDPDDKGGETYKGIARKFWPQWPGWPFIDGIKRQYGSRADIVNRIAGSDVALQSMVRLFYKKEFWDVHGLDQVGSQRVAEEMFDTGVNMSAEVAARLLQEALNLCNNAGKLYPNIATDGKVGPVTRSMLERADPVRIFKTMNLLQGERYLDILRRNETQEKFWGGWMNRVICE